MPGNKYGEFIKREFRLFFALYSNGTLWPKTWKQAAGEEKDYEQWLDHTMGSTAELDIPYQALSKENIKALK